MLTEPPEAVPASRGGVVTALLLLVVVGAMTLLTLRPPAPEPADAPAGAFSAARAMETVTAIAGQPRPLGSPASDAVRDLLVDRLRAEGLDARVMTSVGANGFGGEATVGRVDNIVATLPGTDPTGAVVLAAHYDSVAAGPGAADDGVAVAAVLETVRALRTQAHCATTSSCCSPTVRRMTCSAPRRSSGTIRCARGPSWSSTGRRVG